MTPFAQYTPDQPRYYSSGSPLIRNVVPTQSGFRPFPSLVALSSALEAEPQGFFFSVEADGSVLIFAATADKLWKLDPTDFTWADVSRTTPAYSGNATEGWVFAKYNSVIVATNGNDNVQAFTVGTSSAFDDLAGSPPKAKRATVVGDYLVLYGLTDDPTGVAWSGTGELTEWRATVNNAGSQTFPDGGEVMFVSPIERNAIILQRYKSRAMVSSPDTGFVFAFSEIEDRGAVSHSACVSVGGRTFFLAEDGFFFITPGGGSTPIGAERVDATVKAAVAATDNLELVTAASDPVNKLVVWAYSTNGTTLDGAIGYAWQLDQWVDLKVGTLTGLGEAATPGETMESLASTYPDLDAMTISLDSARFLGGRPVFAGFTDDYKLGFFDGPALEATLETADMSFAEGRRARIRAFRAITDSPTVYGRIGNRDAWAGAITWGSERLASSRTGRVIANQTGFSHRFRCRIPAGESWSGIAGVEAIESTVLGAK